MTTQKDRIEAAIRHIQTAVDIDPWAMELAVDALKAQGTCEDAVSRQTLQKELALYTIDDVTSQDEAGYNRAINDVQKMVLHLPSAQPDVPDTNVGDMISRQAAIDALDEGAWGKEWDKGLAEAILRSLPSAQPEPLTDKEQRIFLAAMEREEKVCEEFDRNYVHEPYEDSLMSVCKAIRRKVKDTLWT